MSFLAGDRRAGAFAALALVMLASACSRNVTVERPEPGQGIEAVVLRSGETIDFGERERATLEDSVVVVRAGRRAPVTRTIPAGDVASFVVQQLDRARTFGVLGAIALLVTLLVVSSADASYSGG